MQEPEVSRFQRTCSMLLSRTTESVHLLFY